jgi:hypothetical protein
MQPEQLTVNRAELELLAEPWRHDFTSLGFKAPQPNGATGEAASSEEQALCALLDEALNLCRQTNTPPTGVELFCTDGFYGLYALNHGAQSLQGLGPDRTELARARLVAKILGRQDQAAFDYQASPALDKDYGFGICAGGLTQVSDPGALLRALAQHLRGPLVIQSAVSLAPTRPDYFRSPPPHQSSGSCFSYDWLLETVQQSGWVLVEANRGKLRAARRQAARGWAGLLCVPPSWVQAGWVKPADPAAAREKKGLWDAPNKFAQPCGISLGKTITICGYQPYQIRDGKVIPLQKKSLLRRKQELVTPYFNPKFLTGKSVLDIGANGGFFSFWACQAGASPVVALDMDEAYLNLIRKAQTHLGWDQLRTVNCRAQDWEEPADLVLAFAMIHWLYSCTANFGSLDRAVAKLASLTQVVLLIEWVAPDDPAILFFKHTEWNRAQAEGPYTLQAFEEALRKHFHKVEVVGATSPTRTLYAACQPCAGMLLEPALPLLAPVERLLHSKCLLSHKGVNLYSRIYAGETPDRLLKQATGDLAAHEAEMLRLVQGPHFPRVLKVEQLEGYSVLTLERIAGLNLLDALPKVSATPKSAASFMGECLAILGELRAARLEHRDVRPANLMVREGRPVLLDFGWAQAEGKPFLTPSHLGLFERIPSGPTCDLYSMGKVFEQLVPQHSNLFAPLLHLMTTPSLARTLPLESFVQVLAGLELPAKWDVEPVFAALKPQVAPPGTSSIIPGLRPPYVQRTWRRWKRSVKKRLGRGEDQ